MFRRFTLVFLLLVLVVTMAPTQVATLPIATGPSYWPGVAPIATASRLPIKSRQSNGARRENVLWESKCARTWAWLSHRCGRPGFPGHR